MPDCIQSIRNFRNDSAAGMYQVSLITRLFRIEKMQAAIIEA